MNNSRHDHSRRSQDYYRTTILSEETDPNKLHDLKADAGRLSGLRAEAGRQQLVELFLGGADRDRLDPILDACVAVYTERARRGRAGGLQGQGQGVLPHLRLPLVDPARTPTPSGRSSRSS